MSVQAMTWVLEDCPDLPSHLVSTMMGLANHADRNGRGAFVAAATIAWYTRKGRDAARDDLDRLEALGLIRRGDQRMVLHLPADSRPVVYDLAMERKRAAKPERRRPGRPRKAKPQVSDLAENGGVPGPPRGDEDQNGNRGGPQPESGGPTAGFGGAQGPPEPPFEPNPEPPPPTPDPDEPVVVDENTTQPDPITALLDRARTAAGLRAAVGRRHPAHRLVREAIGRGWTPDQILAVLSQPLSGAAAPVAAFTWRAREQLAGAPPVEPERQPGDRSVRWTVPWCDSCDDPRTRRAYANPADPHDDTRAGPCPTCGLDSMRLTSVA